MRFKNAIAKSHHLNAEAPTHVQNFTTYHFVFHEIYDSSEAKITEVTNIIISLLQNEIYIIA